MLVFDHGYDYSLISDKPRDGSKPVSILKPYRTLPKTLFGLHKGIVESKDDLIDPVDVQWDAEQC